MSSNNYYDNSLRFKVNKQIADVDIHLVKLFFQMKKTVNGGDLISFNYDKCNKVIILTYMSNLVKQNVMKNKCYQFRNYEFQLIERYSFSDENDEKIANMLIISNVCKNEVSLDDIIMYASYLVDEMNDVKEVDFSNVFENVAYIEYDKIIDINEIKKKLIKSPILGLKKIEIYEAYNTQIMLLKLINNFNNTEDYLNNNFKHENHYYWQLPFKFNDSPFAIIKFSTMDYKNEYLKLIEENEKKLLLIECCPNNQFLNNYLDALTNKNCENDVIILDDNDEVNEPIVEYSNELDSNLEFNELSQNSSQMDEIELINRPDSNASYNNQSGFGMRLHIVHKQSNSFHIDKFEKPAQSSIALNGQHLKSPKKPLCSLCDYHGPKSRIEIHMAHHDKNNYPNGFKCNICDYYASREHHIRLHLKSCHHE